MCNMMNGLRNLMHGLAVAGCLVAAAANPAGAQVGVNIHLGPAPPPRYERVGPPPRHGCFFRRGHWTPRRDRWAWIPGHWVCPR
jgi:hypothetical protein